METACADITDVSWLNVFEVGEWGRLPGDRMRSGGIQKGKPSNKPQGVPLIQSRHFPRTGLQQVLTGTLVELTCCIFPNMIVQRTWGNDKRGSWYVGGGVRVWYTGGF